MVESANIRNVAFAGHSSGGKTSLTESFLYVSKTIPRQSTIEDGHTVSDFDQNEIKRKISINTSIAPFNWQNFKINILDTPGYTDFFGEVTAALTAAETAVIVVDALSGVRVQTDRVNSLAADNNMARLFFINRLDKEHAKFNEVVDEIKDLSSTTTAAAFLPIGLEGNLKGIVDLISLKAYEFSDNEAKEIPIPDELKSDVDSNREKLIEAAAENDDSLLEKYLDSGSLEQEEIVRGLRAGVKSSQLSLIFCGSALKNIGISTTIDHLIELCPSPLESPGLEATNDGEINIKISATDPFSALIFKTVSDPYVGKLSYFKVLSGNLKKDQSVYNISSAEKHAKLRVAHIFEIRGKEQKEITDVVTGDIAAAPKLEATKTNDIISTENKEVDYKIINFPESVLSFAIDPKSKGDEEKISTSLHKLASEDPTLIVRRDAQTKETVVSGMGDMHLEIILDRLKQNFHVEAELHTPKIPFRETIKGAAKAQGKYKKQTGGRGQYGDVWLRLESLERGKEYEFLDEIKGGAVPSGYIPAVEKGIRERMERGVLAGYPVVDVRVALYDGSFHPVDSSEMAFKIAASLAFKQAFEQAKPMLLEPLMDVEVHVPEKYIGDVIGDLSSKRGRVSGTEAGKKYQTVRAQVPLAEISEYAIQLRSITHGEGDFIMTFSHYEETPPDISQKIIAKAQQEQE